MIKIYAQEILISAEKDALMPRDHKMPSLCSSSKDPKSEKRVKQKKEGPDKNSTSISPPVFVDRNQKGYPAALIQGDSLPWNPAISEVS